MSGIPINYRPLELQRQRRLVELDRWARGAITADELMQTIAQQRLVDRAISQYAVTYPTALGYARVILFKLRKEAMKVEQH